MCRRIPALDENICALDDPKLSCCIVVGAGAVKSHSVRVAKDRTTLDRQQSRLRSSRLRSRRRQGCWGCRGDEDRRSGGIAAEKWHEEPEQEQGQQSYGDAITPVAPNLGRYIHHLNITRTLAHVGVDRFCAILALSRADIRQHPCLIVTAAATRPDAAAAVSTTRPATDSATRPATDSATRPAAHATGTCTSSSRAHRPAAGNHTAGRCSCLRKAAGYATATTVHHAALHHVAGNHTAGRSSCLRKAAGYATATTIHHAALHHAALHREHRCWRCRVEGGSGKSGLELTPALE